MQSEIKQRAWDRNFSLMVAGQIISLLGSALIRFALSLYVLDITGREDIFATMFAISNIPLLLAPIGGAIADRFNRRNLMIIFDLISSFVVLCLVLLLLWGNSSIFIIGTVMFLLAIVSSMYQPSVQASIPLLVRTDKLEQANGIVNGVNALSNMMAPVLGGILYGAMGVKTLVIASCVAFLLSAAMLLLIKIPFTKREQAGHIVPIIAKDMKEGFSYVIKQSLIMKSTAMAALLNLFLVPFFTVGAPIILRVTMKSNDVMYGAGMGIIELNTILGALLIGFVAKKMKIRKLYIWFGMIAVLIVPVVFAISPMLLGLGYYPSYILFFIGAAPIAFILTTLSIYVITHVQKQTPGHLLGKVMATIIAVAQSSAPLGQILYGILFRSFSGQVYIPVLFLCIIMLAIAVFVKRALKNEKEEIVIEESV